MSKWKLFIHKLFILHVWETTNRYTKTVYANGDKPGVDLPIKKAVCFELRCKDCGTIRVKKKRV